MDSSKTKDGFEIKVAVVGNGSVGKSTVLMALLRGLHSLKTGWRRTTTAETRLEIQVVQDDTSPAKKRKIQVVDSKTSKPSKKNGNGAFAPGFNHGLDANVTNRNIAHDDSKPSVDSQVTEREAGKGLKEGAEAAE